MSVRDDVFILVTEREADVVTDAIPEGVIVREAVAVGLIVARIEIVPEGEIVIRVRVTSAENVSD